MKKILLFILAVAATMQASAKWQGDGFYRVQNYETDRYAYLLDNRAVVDMGATKVDLSAIELWLGEDRMVSDPSTVLYIKSMGDKLYDIQAQGTGVYQMIQELINLREKSGTDAYYAYGTYSSVTKYLGDPSPYSTPQSYMADNCSGDYRLWYVKPIDANTANYFGIKPTIEVGGEYYSPVFCGFNYDLIPAGAKACYVCKVDPKMGVAVYKELADGKVRGGTPVFVKCAGANPADNKTTVGADCPAAPADNLLKGVYFNNDRYGHVNHVAYDPATMRVLGVTSEGKLGYVTANIDFIPRNTAYLTVPAGTPAELCLLTEEEYQAGVADAVISSVKVQGRQVLNPNAEAIAIYNMLGTKLYSGKDGFMLPAAGLYLISTPARTIKTVVK